MQAAGQVPKVANIVIPSIVAIVATTGGALQSLTRQDEETFKEINNDIAGQPAYL